ncbi:replication protein RepA [Fimbriiglobus ruber]|uniref:IncW-like replication protein n=1 Tax=Fimbriiglobus ruber TaxID=1908690 RepID=A0A225CZW5_9BACT|nr:replication protein RepA [Fimbriiglobus ruber]OWK34900.1 IncW-like replication protein [Fimbriiglobus ruber]
MTQPPQKLLSPTQRKRLDAATDIRSTPPDRIDFLHTVQCQCGIPYGNPGDAVREWERRQGMATLRIEAGSAYDPATGQFVQMGLPYGEKPRLVLIHLATEAIRTRSPVIDVEDSMTAFARSLGIAITGPHLRHLKDQLSRLASATVRMGMVEGGRAVQVNTQIVSAFDLWYPAEPGQRMLWPSTVKLSAEYYASLQRHAVPLDRRAVGALAGSALALDVYTWLAQRLHRVSVGQPQFIPWSGVYEQFGQGYDRVRDFRKRFLSTLQQVHAVYPQARLSADDRGLTLENSPPPITGKTNSLMVTG